MIHKINKFLIPMHDHRHPVVSHPDVLVNVGRTLVPLAAIRTLEPRLLATIILHMCFQRFLVRVSRVTNGAVIGHLSRIPERAVFVLDRGSPSPVLDCRPPLMVMVVVVVVAVAVQRARLVVGWQRQRPYEQENRGDR